MSYRKFYRIARKAMKKEMPEALAAAYIKEGMKSRLEGIYWRIAYLFQENADAPKAVQKHYMQILPCIAFYDDLLEVKGSRGKALAFFDEHVLEEMPASADRLRKLMRRTGLYRIGPQIFTMMTKKNFGKASGFELNDLKIKGVFAIDMTKCPYVETCRKYKHPEIAHYFCDSDDICYGNIHPSLEWKRTKTLGRGDEVCDFRLYKKKNQH